MDQRIVAQRHLKLALEFDSKPINAIAFNVDVNAWPDMRCEQVFAAYRLDVNDFRGKRNLQLIIDHLEKT